MDIMIQDTNFPTNGSVDLENILDVLCLQNMLEDSEDLEFRRLIRAQMRKLKKEKQTNQASKLSGSSTTRSSVPEQKFLSHHQSATTSDCRQAVQNLRKTPQVSSSSTSCIRTPRTDVGQTLESVKLKSPIIAKNDSDVGFKLEEVELKNTPRNVHAPSDVTRKGVFPRDVTLKHVTTDSSRTTVASKGNLLRSKGNPTARQALKHFQEMDNECLLQDPRGSKDLLESVKRISPNTIRDQTLNWCRNRLYGYENINIEDFSTSWSDGLAFCALANSFFPQAFDYDSLTSKDRRRNFQLAFDTLEKEAGVVPLLEVEDMLATRAPDWKCVFTYVNCIIARMAEIRREQEDNGRST